MLSKIEDAHRGNIEEIRVRLLSRLIIVELVIQCRLQYFVLPEVVLYYFTSNHVTDRGNIHEADSIANGITAPRQKSVYSLCQVDPSSTPASMSCVCIISPIMSGLQTHILFTRGLSGWIFIERRRSRNHGISCSFLLPENDVAI